MISKFEEIKEQLRELSEIVNSFKSEAVQIRIIDHLFGTTEPEETLDEEIEPQAPKAKKAKRRKAKKATPSGDQPATKKRTSSGQGAVATLVKLYEDGFFSEKRTIGDIISHCDTNLARKFKPNEMSGKLGRMVRSEELKRSKNDDGQYEYINA